MRVFLDNNLPKRLSDLLATTNQPVIHVHEMGWQDLADHLLIKKIGEESIVWISRDNDFWRAAPSTWAVIWIALHNPSLARLLGEVAEALKTILPQVGPGSRVLFSEDEILHLQLEG